MSLCRDSAAPDPDAVDQRLPFHGSRSLSVYTTNVYSTGSIVIQYPIFPHASQTRPVSVNKTFFDCIGFSLVSSCVLVCARARVCVCVCAIVCLCGRGYLRVHLRVCAFLRSCHIAACLMNVYSSN